MTNVSGKFAIVGLGESQIGRRLGRSGMALQLDGSIQQLCVWDDLRDQTHRLGAGRIDDLSGHREPPGHPCSNCLRQSRRHTRTGQDAHTRVSVSEHGPIGRHEEVASERHLQATGNR